MRFAAVVCSVIIALASAPAVFARSNADVEGQVRAYFADAPVMANIAACESKFRQYTDAGDPLYGGAGGNMVGVFQIHTSVHQAYAQELLGYDITTLEGNLGYAKYLYQTEGTAPWNSSRSCWEDMAVSTPTVIAKADPPGESVVLQQLISPFTRTLSLGVVHPEVKTLQQMLNDAGYRVADSGPGSPGEETSMFGSLTRAAVQRFQCDTGIVCEGESHGVFGPQTRAALLATPQHFAITSASTTTSPYPPAHQDEIARLQAQVAELTKVLAELLARQAS